MAPSDKKDDSDEFTRRFDLSELQDELEDTSKQAKQTDQKDQPEQPQGKQEEQTNTHGPSEESPENDLFFDDDVSEDDVEQALNSIQASEPARPQKRPSPVREQSTTPANCNFCMLSQGKIKLEVIHRDSLVVAFLDPKPLARGQILISTVNHTSSMTELNGNEVSHLFKVVQNLSLLLKKNTLIKAEAVSIFMSESVNEQEGLRHLYLNLIPRYKKDGISLKFKEKMSLNKKELFELSQSLKASIKKRQ